jgi:hypothetical protein
MVAAATSRVAKKRITIAALANKVTKRLDPNWSAGWPVESLDVGDEGKLLVSCALGLFLHDGKSWTEIAIPEETSKCQPTAAVWGPRGQIVIGTIGGGVFSLLDGKWVRILDEIEPEGGLSQPQYDMRGYIACEDSGSVWFTPPKEGHTSTWMDGKLMDEALPTGIQNRRCWPLHFDRRHRWMLVGLTTAGGTSKLAAIGPAGRAKYYSYRSPEAVTNASAGKAEIEVFISDICVLEDGSIWLDTNRGLALVSDDGFSEFNKGTWPAENVIAICDTGKTLWVAATKNLARVRAP